MKKQPIFLFALLFVLMAAAAPGDAHLARYRDAVPGDKTVERASKLQIDIPVYCREWHIWWGAPHGQDKITPRWQHWRSLRVFGKHTPGEDIEEMQPGTAWRRYLNSVGYPLLGPYDSGQRSIIRWQLETARNAGITALFIHLWPSLWDKGEDQTPLPLFDIVLDEAARLGYPVGLHEESAFRQGHAAQKPESCARRAVIFLKRYAAHPGYLKIQGMPVYYFQNWGRWFPADAMRRVFEEVEKEVGPVYWIVEGNFTRDYLDIPQIKACMGPNNSWFTHVPPYGAGPHPWDQLNKDTAEARAAAAAASKQFGTMVYTRFNNNHHRAVKPGTGRIDAEDGMFYVQSLEYALKTKPDFLFVTQWNDFQECAFIEPGWDFDGFNADPYRYCRITAAAVGKAFHPAPLPDREALDPAIRHKLFGDTQPGDLGPVMHDLKRDGRKLSWSWGEGSGDPARIRIVQKELVAWKPGIRPYSGEALRQGNPSLNPAAGFSGKTEVRFYAPGLKCPKPETVWMMVHARTAPETQLSFEYRSEMERFRIDSRWEPRRYNTGTTARHDELPDGTFREWIPLYEARFNGFEGDIVAKLLAGKGEAELYELLLWRGDLGGDEFPASFGLKELTLPETLDLNRPWVIVPYDKAGNPGLPRLMAPVPPPRTQQEKTTAAPAADVPAVPAVPAVPGAFSDDFSAPGSWKPLRSSHGVRIRSSMNGSMRPCLSTNDSMLLAELGRTYTRSFTLRFRLRHTQWERAAYVALLTPEGNGGYGLLYDSSIERQYNGCGGTAAVRLEFDSAPVWRKWTKLGAYQPAPARVNSDQAAEFELAWSAATGKLTVKADGKCLAEYPAPEFSRFGKVLIHGQSGAQLADLVISGE